MFFPLTTFTNCILFKLTFHLTMARFNSKVMGVMEWKGKKGGWEHDIINDVKLLRADHLIVS